MRRKTMDPLLEVTAVLPALKGREKAAILLHPEAGNDLSPDASKIGGRIRWSKDQGWPIGKDGEPFLSVLQLRKDEFPEVAFPEESNLVQVLWCPVLSEDEEWAPEVMVYWRTLETLDSIGAPPPSISPERDLVPRECRLWPERVIEYPDAIELGAAFFSQVTDWTPLPDGVVVPALLQKLVEGGNRIAPWKFIDVYTGDLSVAPGTKVLGYPQWVQDAAGQPICDCGRKMDILVTFASSEYEHDTRWGETWDTHKSVEDQFAAASPTGINFYDLGKGYLFYCPVCPERPTSFLVQSS